MAESKKTMKVVGAVTLVTDENGKHQYLYRGSVLPDYVDAKEVKRLTDLGLVAEDKNDEIAPVVAARPVDL